MFLRRVSIVLLAAIMAAAAASAPVGTAGAAPTGGRLIGKHSLRAPVTDETFYFVMAEREIFRTADRQRHRRHPGRSYPARFRSDEQGGL